MFTVRCYRDHQAAKEDHGMQYNSREDAIQYARDWLKGRLGRRAIVRRLATEAGQRAGFYPMNRIFDEVS